jgi:hypothetical protein
MKAICIPLAATILVAAGGSSVLGQNQAVADTTTSAATTLPSTGFLAPGYGGGYGYYAPDRSSTAAEGFLRGLGSMAAGAGEYNLLTAQAGLLSAEAYRLALANHDADIQSYYALKRENAAYRQEQQGPRPTTEELARLAAQGIPERLSPGELSRTGEISWPLLLRAGQYSQDREELQQAFARRAGAGEVGPEEAAQVRQVTDAMAATLQKSIRSVDPMQYIAARRFIRGLDYEFTQPTE